MSRKTARRKPRKEPGNVLFRIKRGLSGYVSYLAACEMNEAFSEYVLYEPMLRILMARGFHVECEYRCKGMPAESDGERVKRIDFVAKRRGLTMAIEVKWTESQRVDIVPDHRKLAWFTHEHNPAARAFLCVFGRKSNLNKMSLVCSPNYAGRFREKGEAVYAEFRATRYGCKIYELYWRPKQRSAAAT